MRLTDILQPDCVKVPLQADGKEPAIHELVELLYQAGGIADRDKLATAVWQREMTRTTGIGHGIAIPHGKADGVDRLRMAIGRLEKPLDFGAIDGKPVSLVLLLVSPADQTGPHIQALAKISRMLTNELFRQSLKEAESADQLYQMIAQHETEAAV